MSRVVVTGGAGFVGSHLCEALVARGDQVVCIDNLSSGHRDNLVQLDRTPGFEFICADLCEGVNIGVYCRLRG